MNLPEALAALNANATAEWAGLTAVTDPSEHAAMFAPAITRYLADEALIRSLFPTDAPQAPAGYQLLWVDDFDTLDTDRWSLFGPGLNETWGQQYPQHRQGFYSPNAVSVSDSVLTITTIPDPQGRTATSGLPGWQCGFLASRQPLPKWGHFAVRYQIVDPTDSWAWEAPLWLTHGSKGADEAEVDVCERFANRPLYARQAVHLRKNGGATTYNIGPALLNRNHEALFGGGGWHVDEAIIEPDGAHARFTLIHDGIETYSFSTAELTGYTNWLGTLTGWNARICTQVGGAGGTPPSSAAGPYEMHIDWVAVSVPQ